MNVPAFTFENIEGDFPYRCGVQDADHGTFIDNFALFNSGKSWVVDVLVAYFGMSMENAQNLVEDAVHASIRVGQVFPNYSKFMENYS